MHRHGVRWRLVVTLRAPVQETLAALPFRNLALFELRPEMFSDYLVKTHGFKLIKEINVGESTATKGFDRPLLVFQKQ